VAPASMERTILSIGIDGDFGHTNGKPRAARKLLSGIDEPIDSHERSRQSLAKSRECARRGIVAPGAEWSEGRRRPRMRGVSEESFRLIVETIPGLIAVMTPAGSVEHVNRQVLEYFGRTLDELKQWGTSDAVHPDDLPRVIAAWTHAFATGPPYEFD